MKKLSLLAVLTILFLTVAAVMPAAADTPEDTVAAYHRAILDGDIQAATGMLHKDLLLFEDGIPETSLDQYAKGHMKSDIAFSEKAKRKLESQKSWMEGDTATVSSTYDLKTKYKGKSYHLKSAETMTLKQIEGRWTIVHIHWSNHQVKE